MNNKKINLIYKVKNIVIFFVVIFILIGKCFATEVEEVLIPQNIDSRCPGFLQAEYEKIIVKIRGNIEIVQYVLGIIILAIGINLIFDKLIRKEKKLNKIYFNIMKITIYLLCESFICMFFLNDIYGAKKMNTESLMVFLFWLVIMVILLFGVICGVEYIIKNIIDVKVRKKDKKINVIILFVTLILVAFLIFTLIKMQSIYLPNRDVIFIN